MLNLFLRAIVLISCLLSLAFPAFAMTEAQVIDRLATIPVFLITDGDGIPLVGTNRIEKDGKEERVLPFFLSPTEAEATVKTIEDKDLQAQVIVRSMEDMYNFVQSNKDKDLIYQLVPSATSLKAAAELSGGDEDQLPNVPIFFAIDKQDGKEGLFTLSQGERTFIPFFFEKEELDRLIAEVNKKDEGRNTEVKVISFFQVLNSMVDTPEKKAGEEVEKFAFFPGQTSLTWIKEKTETTPSAQP